MNIFLNKISRYTFLFISRPLLIHIFVFIIYIFLCSYFSNPILCDDTLSSEVSSSTEEIVQEQRFLQLKATVTSELNKWNEIYTNCKSYNNMLEEAERRPERHVDLINFLKAKEAY